MASLILERVEVAESSVEAFVRVPADAPVGTGAVPGLAARAFEAMPGLVRHRCVSGSAHGIREELADTQTPHLLEHVALELMALSGSPRELAGETVWDFAADGRRVFRVRIGYDDDLVALGALDAAARVVDGLLGRAPMPDIAQEVLRLSALRLR